MKNLKYGNCILELCTKSKYNKNHYIFIYVVRNSLKI